MKGNWRRQILWYSLTAAASLYVFFPLFAGLFALGTKDGPSIYLRTHHRLLYAMGYNMVHEDTPREPARMRRPLFYGMDREPIAGPK